MRGGLVGLKLYLYAAALLALAGLGGYVWHLKGKADRVDVAEAAQKQAEAKAIELSETYARARAADVKDAADLAALRSEMGAQSLLFSQMVKAKPLVREVIREVNGVPVTCPERDPVRYFELFNQAVTGAPDS